MGKREEFSDVLKELMSKKGLSQTDLANRLGKNRTTIHSWLQAHSKYPKEKNIVLKIAQALDLNEEEADRLLLSANRQRLNQLRFAIYADPENENYEEIKILISFWGELRLPTMRKSPFQIPMSHGPLFGRDREWQDLRQKLLKGGIYVLSGMPAVGKTMFAVNLGHDLREAFPDGVLWLGLSSIKPNDSEDDKQWAIVSQAKPTLSAYGRSFPSPETIPSIQLAFRDVLENKQALLLIDDAPSQGIIVNWLPSTRHCTVLITTQNQHVHNMTDQNSLCLLTGLSFEASVQFLRHKLGDERMDIALEDGKTGVQQIHTMVEGLPLALELVAESLRHVTIDEYVEKVLLQELRASLKKGWAKSFGVNIDINRVFQYSFDRLAAPVQKIFSYLSIFETGFFTAPALAFVAKLTDYKTLRFLLALETASLITAHTHEPNGCDQSTELVTQFYIHRLLRIFAGYQLGDETNIHDLRLRLIDYYADFAHTHRQFKDWVCLESEQNNIDLVLKWANDFQDYPLLLKLGLSLTVYDRGYFGYLDLCGHYEQARRLFAAIVEEPDDFFSTCDTATQVDVLLRLGIFTTKQSGAADAEQYFKQAMSLLLSLEMSEENAHRHAYLSEQLAQAEMQLNGDSEIARDWIEQAVNLLRRYSNDDTSRYLSGHLQLIDGEMLGKYQQQIAASIVTVEAGLKNLPQEMTRSHLKGYILLFNLYRIAGNFDKRDEYSRRVIELADQLNDVHALAAGLRNQANTLKNQGDYVESQKLALRAKELFDQIGQKVESATMLQNIGRTYRILQLNQDCRKALLDALQTFFELETNEYEAYTRLELAALEMSEQNFEQAEKELSIVHQICRTRNDLYLMPYALSGIAELACMIGDLDKAYKTIKEALDLTNNSRRKESRGIVLSVYGLILDALNQPTEAAQAHKEALELLEGGDLHELEKAKKRMK